MGLSLGLLIKFIKVIETFILPRKTIKLGFEVLKERNKGTMPMYLDLVNNSKFGI